MNRCFSSTYSVWGTMLGAWDKMDNEAGTALVSKEFVVQVLLYPIYRQGD